MTLDDVRQSLTATDPPAELTLALVGLWWDAKGDWKRAHEAAQQDQGPEGAWVHAYENMCAVDWRMRNAKRRVSQPRIWQETAGPFR